MIAVSVMSIAMLSVLVLLPTAAQLSQRTDEYEAARNAAQQQMARIRSQIATIRSAGGNQDIDVTGLNDNKDTFEVPDLNLRADDMEQGVMEVSDGPDGPADPVKQFTIRVRWRSGVDGRDMEIEIPTLIRNIR